jgi:MFS family permease
VAPWTSAGVVAPIAAGLATLGAFVTWELRTRHPMLPFSMFRSVSFTGANAISFSLYAGLFGALFLMSQFFQAAQGASPLRAGAELLAWSATGLFVAPQAGRLADRFGNRPFIVAGLAMQTVGLGAVAILARPDAAFLELAPFLVIAGSGTALAFTTVANEVMASVSPERTGIASGINSALRELGGVFGVAVLASVFAHAGGYGSPAEFVDGFRPALWVAVAFSACGLPIALAATSGRGSPSPGSQPGPRPPVSASA